MIPTQDPTYTAMHLLRQVKDRPISVYFGLVRGRKRSNALLGGSTNRQDLVKALPQESLVIGPSTRQETLAAAITAVWERLAAEIKQQVAG